MNLGNKITSSRKELNLSQEELSEKVGVTRQTISKWELGETTPDIKQAKELAKIFKISLDELTDNDIKDILINKVSNTERLAEMVINILKLMGIGFIVMIILSVIAFILFNFGPLRQKDTKVIGTYSLICNLDDKNYEYSIQYNKNYVALISGGDAFIDDHVNFGYDDNANQMLAKIEDYFKDRNGNCKTEKQ